MGVSKGKSTPSQMPDTPNMLTNAAIKAAKPRAKPYKVFDQHGLFLMVMPAGHRWWRLKYRFDGREKLFSFGVYPEISLREARDKRDDARKLLRNRIDPGAKRRAEAAAAGESFKAIAREWFERFSPKWAVGHSSKLIRRLEFYIFPWLGNRPIAKIEAPDILACLRRIEAKGNLESAHRALQVCGRVFRYGVATGRAQRDPTGDLRGASPPADEKHLASFTDPKSVGALLRAINSYEGSIIVRAALRLAPLVFVRPGELRAAEGSEINFATREWRIRAARMKLRQPHIVPLSDQAIRSCARSNLSPAKPNSCSPRPEATSGLCPTMASSPRCAAWGTSRVRSPFTDSDRRHRPFSTSKAGTEMPSSGSSPTGSVTPFEPRTITRSICRSVAK